jgi:ATP-dependent Clp protease ATP-binding subunit ClpC
MTSNVGTRDIKIGGKIGFTESTAIAEDENVKNTIEESIKRLFNPEFINRIDDFIIFHKLRREHIFEIIDIQLEELRKRLKVNNMTLELTTNAKNFLVDKGFDDKFGARPLRRALQKYVEDDLADSMLRGNLKGGSRIVVDLAESGNHLTFSFLEPAIKEEEELLNAIDPSKIGKDSPDLSITPTDEVIDHDLDIENK